MRGLRELCGTMVIPPLPAIGMRLFAINGTIGRPDESDCDRVRAGHLSLISYPEEVADSIPQAAGVSPAATPNDAITAGS